jgi:5-methylcytosine-specific restriction enzyme A
METKPVIIENYGILASMSWNSNKWADDPTEQDLNSSNYDFVKNERHMHESLNFAHEKYPAEVDGYYVGYTPMLNKLPAVDKQKTVNILFLFSSDYKNGNKKSIIGLYGYPAFGEWTRHAQNPVYSKYDWGNIAALPENIIYFDSPVIISNDVVLQHKLLPDGKQISQQGFNYLNSDNVLNLLVIAAKLNPNNTKLTSFTKKFPLLVDITKERLLEDDFYEVVGESDADTTKGIMELELKMAKQTPEIKQRISNYIERGSIANKVKSIADYKCLVCEAMGQNPYSFKKPNGNYYIETHHVEPVSTLKKGVLSINNLIAVCANHHRQLHYGNTQVLEHTLTNFKFSVNGTIILVKALKLN